MSEKTTSDARGMIALIAAATVLLLGAYGWADFYDWQIAQKAPEIVVRSVYLFVPMIENVKEGNAITRVAAVLGTLSTSTGVVLLWFSLTGHSIDRTWTRFFRRDHVILVGETPLLQQIRRNAGERKLDSLNVTDKTYRAAARAGRQAQNLVRQEGLLRAAHVVVDLDDDVATLDAFGSILERLDGETRHRCQSMVAKVSDLELAATTLDLIAARRAAALPTDPVPASCFDPDTETARTLVREARLFVRASARGQKRVHVLLVGFEPIGERVIDQIFLSCVAGGLDLPRVTILDPKAAEIRARLAVARPVLLDTLPIAFVPLDLDQDSMADAHMGQIGGQLLAMEREIPFTGLLVCSRDRAAATSAARRLCELQSRQDVLLAPIFLWHLLGEGFDFVLPISSDLSDDADRGICPIRVSLARLTDAALGEASRRQLALRSHAAYSKRAGGPLDGASLATLNVTLQRANERAADHVPALLWSAGLADGRDGITTEAGLDAAKGLLAAASAVPDARILALAALEHRRWCVERHLDGWRYGAVRDNRRKLHPLLVPFDALGSEEVAKDVDRVRETITFALEAALGARGEPS